MHGMHGMDVSAGSMSIGTGVPSMFHLQNMYWAVIGAVVAFAAAVNILEMILCRQRLVNSKGTITFGVLLTGNQDHGRKPR